MAKVKELYRSKIHINDKSHDVCIVQDNINVNGSKFKMTYECYNAVERFTGERFVGGKWEHTLSMLDLGVTANTSMYIKSSAERLERAEGLIKKGITFFNILHG